MSELRLSVASIAVLGALFALSATAIDIVIPLLPLMTAALGGAAGEGPLLISGYLFGYGVAQFFWGVLSDRFGRRPIMTVGLVGFIIISFLCALASSMTVLLILRISQGIFGASGPVLARAIARDFGAQQKDQTLASAKLLSQMSALLGLAPLLAPLVGTFAVLLYGWEGVFILLGLFSLLTLIGGLLVLPETLEVQMRRPLTQNLIIEKLKRLSIAREFWLGTLVLAFLFGGYFIIIAGSAGVLSARYEIGITEFTKWFVVAALFYVAGSMTSRALLRKRSPLQNLVLAKWAVILVSLTLIIFALISPLPFWVLWALICIYIFCTGFTLPNATAIAMEQFQDMAGTASSAMGFMQVGLGAVITGVYSLIRPDDVAFFAFSVGLCGLLIILPSWYFWPKNRVLAI